MRERDRTAFAAMLKTLIATHASRAPKFVEYFQTYYSSDSRVRKWAWCFRDLYHAGQETNMMNESWNNQLKIHHLKAKRNRNVHSLILTLLDAEKKYYCKQLQNEFGRRIDRVAVSDRVRQTAGAAIPDCDVRAVANGLVEVKAQAANAAQPVWIVSAARLCAFGCTQLCVHNLTCECPDALRTQLPCKHIHKVFSLQHLHK